MSGSEGIEAALFAVNAIKKSPCVLDAFKEQISSLAGIRCEKNKAQIVYCVV